MIQEAIKHVAERAIENAAARVLKVPGEPLDVVYIDVPGKPLERRICEPAPRNYTARTLTGLCEQINHFNNDFVPDGGICVFVGRSEVVVSIGEDVRRDHISMPLVFSQPFAWLREATQTGRSLTQKELVWLLRSTFRNDVVPASFCTDIRQVRFTGGSDGQSDVGNGSEALRKSVQASMAMGSGSALPEEIAVYASVYEGIADVDMRFRVIVAVDVNLSEQKFILKVLPGEVERCEIDAVSNIAEYIRETCKGVTVFVDSAME